MIWLRNRTEYSFNYAVGRITDVLEAQPRDATAAGIADRSGTWGHVAWSKACKAKGLRPIYGVELGVVPDTGKKERQPTAYMTFLAQSSRGLSELYALVTKATSQFYREPLLCYDDVLKASQGNIITFSGQWFAWERWSKWPANFYIELNQLTPVPLLTFAKRQKLPIVATCDNLYPGSNDLSVYQMIMGERLAQMTTAPRHILSEWEWRLDLEHKGINQLDIRTAIWNADKIVKQCKVELPRADIVHPKVTFTLEKMCDMGAKERGVNLKVKNYSDRLARELKLIHDKKFEDYFYVVADMINWAKSRGILVGPARGSSCGSLVCYLIGITDIDPMPYDLLFERFIDLNREDYPDIDVDFPDKDRERVFDYIRSKYGADKVARIGTINVFKAKSALTICAKEFGIPFVEMDQVKGAIIERSTGDARAQFCIKDTLETLHVGQQILAKYPELQIAAKMEGHANHAGMHAAGIVITSEPITNFCSFDHHTGAVQIDKKDAETLNMLKIDALGLRTLSVIAETLTTIGKKHDWLLKHTLSDHKAFAVLNESRFAGIFQFEGFSVQTVTKQIGVNCFEDIAHLTALARPGPFQSGSTTEYVKRHTKQNPVTYLHPLACEITAPTYGVIIYQEQVMQIARTIGSLSWEDVSELRKAMSKSMGKEFFDRYWEKFWKGAKQKGITEELAQKIWHHINTMGSWAFNRSHAIAYGTISYWCCVLKAHYSLQFAAACLRNAKDTDQSVKILRELAKEGIHYDAYDARLSEANWTVKEGRLIGGLTGIKGIGPKLATTIIHKRRNGLKFSPREATLLSNGRTAWDNIFECRDLWGHVVTHPEVYKIKSKIVTLDQITDDSEGDFVFIGKIMAKNLSDHNEIQRVKKRGGTIVKGQTLFLDVTVEDDTSNISIQINRHHYLKIGVPIVEHAKIGDWYLWKGNMPRKGWRRIYLEKCRRMTGNSRFSPTLIKKK